MITGRNGYLVAPNVALPKKLWLFLLTGPIAKGGGKGWLMVVTRRDGIFRSWGAVLLYHVVRPIWEKEKENQNKNNSLPYSPRPSLLFSVYTTIGLQSLASQQECNLYAIIPRGLASGTLRFREKVMQHKSRSQNGKSRRYSIRGRRCWERNTWYAGKEHGSSKVN